MRFEVEAATVAYESYRDSFGKIDSATISAKQNLERYQEEYEEATIERNVRVETMGITMHSPLMQGLGDMSWHTLASASCEL